MQRLPFLFYYIGILVILTLFFIIYLFIFGNLPASHIATLIMNEAINPCLFFPLFIQSSVGVSTAGLGFDENPIHACFF